METINCDICGNQRPQIEMIPVEYDDDNYAVCIHCVESELREWEMMSHEPLYPSLGVIEEEDDLGRW